MSLGIAYTICKWLRWGFAYKLMLTESVVNIFSMAALSAKTQDGWYKKYDLVIARDNSWDSWNLTLHKT